MPDSAVAAFLVECAIACVLALLLVTAAPAAEAGPQGAALERAANAVVGIEVRAAREARSIETLGRLRSGSGVVIGPDDLVLTIGYLVLEADEVAVVLDSGKRLPARAVAYDLASGFGLVQPLVPLGIAPVPLVAPTAVRAMPGADEPLLMVSGGDEGLLSVARLAARRPFSGYWEYHIEDALFTAPARTDHSGAGLFNVDGELIGIGSLLVASTASESRPGPGNMFVPVQLLAPILDEMRARGSSSASRRAWLGLNCSEQEEGLRVLRVSRDGPAESAGVAAGDLILAIDGQPVRGLESFYKALWSGGVEREVRLELRRNGEGREVLVRSVDRMGMLRRAPGI
ncbi:S1C family serine protease [Rivibacter subsaxonicus]|nr:S1C family serine protease [Rivibacter subsaxonicus]